MIVRHENEKRFSLISLHYENGHIEDAVSDDNCILGIDFSEMR